MGRKERHRRRAAVIDPFDIDDDEDTSGSTGDSGDVMNGMLSDNERKDLIESFEVSAWVEI